MNLETSQEKKVAVMPTPAAAAPERMVAVVLTKAECATSVGNFLSMLLNPPDICQPVIQVPASRIREIEAKSANA